jgi:TrmH family RNA methyltransferase
VDDRPDTPVLTNPGSDRVKAVRALSGRSTRSRSGRFAVEGPQAVREAVRFAAGAVRDVYLTPDAAERYPEIVAEARGRGLHLQVGSDDVLTAMSSDCQGVLAVVDIPHASLAEVLAAAPRLVAVLSNVRDPGNAGTVIRAADAAGADAVVVTESSVELVNPKVVRATAGSLFHLPVVTDVALAEALGALRATGLTVLAADGTGEHDLDELLDAAEDARAMSEPRAGATSSPARSAPPDLAAPTAWLFGNEAWGLAPEDRALADAVVRVPIHGRAESLNLATAAAICLYASARAQRPPSMRRG